MLYLVPVVGLSLNLPVLVNHVGPVSTLSVAVSSNIVAVLTVVVSTSVLVVTFEANGF